MDKFLRGFITIEKSIQMATLIGLMLFLGYLEFVNYRAECLRGKLPPQNLLSNRTPSNPVTSPTTQQRFFTRT